MGEGDKNGLKETAFDTGWTELAQDRIQLVAHVKTVMELHVT
jgi:hypothetical protein